MSKHVAFKYRFGIGSRYERECKLNPKPYYPCPGFLGDPDTSFRNKQGHKFKTWNERGWSHIGNLGRRSDAVYRLYWRTHKELHKTILKRFK